MKTYAQISKERETITCDGVVNIVNNVSLNQLISDRGEMLHQLQGNPMNKRIRKELIRIHKNVEEVLKIYLENYMSKNNA